MMQEPFILVKILLAVLHLSRVGDPPLLEELIHGEATPVTLSTSEEIFQAAEQYADLRIPYRLAYPKISYPVGDIHPDQGLCCDVVVRACRAAGIDLQELVYRDSRAARGEYIRANRYHSFARPLNRSWIHRRTSNLDLFLDRHAVSLPTRYDSREKDLWQAGDIVIYEKNGYLTWHIGIVSDRVHPRNGVPYLIDAWIRPGYSSERNTLTSHGAIGGHYRIPDALVEHLSRKHRKRARRSWKSFLAYHTSSTPGSDALDRDIRTAPVANSPFRGRGGIFGFGSLFHQP